MSSKKTASEMHVAPWCYNWTELGWDGTDLRVGWSIEHLTNDGNKQLWYELTRCPCLPLGGKVWQKKQAAKKPGRETRKGQEKDQEREKVKQRLFLNVYTGLNDFVYTGLNQSVTNIFEYSNIRIYWSRIYIRTFVRINFSFTNIFGHSFVSNLFVRIYSDIRWWVC